MSLRGKLCVLILALPLLVALILGSSCGQNDQAVADPKLSGINNVPIRLTQAVSDSTSDANGKIIKLDVKIAAMGGND
ncbi:hypothetical protein KKF61_06365 [Patescibacteria group bacterium]|nr:hypothetical protein [Patescibacteria group bacterium]MBU0964114.1 hypothetical protein [Patescibacteria group bacterium]